MQQTWKVAFVGMYYVTTCYQQKSTTLALVLEKWQVVIFYMHSENTQGLWLDDTCLRILHNRRDIDYKVSSIDIRIFIKTYVIRVNKHLTTLGMRKSIYVWFKHTTSFTFNKSILIYTKLIYSFIKWRCTIAHFRCSF